MKRASTLTKGALLLVTGLMMGGCPELGSLLDLVSGISRTTVRIVNDTDFSVDPNVKRTGGAVGWLPRNAVPELDRLLFGDEARGIPPLAVGTLSDPITDPQTRLYNIYFISEHSEAREVGDEAFESLKDKALTDYLNQEFKRLDVYLVLDDKIYAWVNAKVKIASILPTPTPASGIPGLPSGYTLSGQ